MLQDGACGEMPSIDFRNMDCMDLMSEYEDNYFDLAIVDPPYGINAGNIFSNEKRKSVKSGSYNKSKFTRKNWDNNIPQADYFKELFRVSKNSIIWGANYMTEYLPSSMGWIVWDKDNGTTAFSDCELAFSTFDRALRKFTFTWNGFLQGDMKNKEIRIHPTQKPVRLYAWLLTNYAKKGDKILDTMVGSASSLIACHQLGFDVVGCEIDEEYYNLAQKRIKEEVAQLSMWSGE